MFPLLAALQVNLHAALLPIFLLYAFLTVLPSPRDILSLKGIAKFYRENAFRLFCVLLMLPAALLSPNGMEGALYLFLSYANATGEIGISEMSPPVVLSIFGGYLFAASLLFLMVMRKKDCTPSGAALYTFLFSFAASLLHVRNIWLLSIGSIPYLTALLRSFCPIHEDGVSQIPRRKQRGMVNLLSKFVHPREAGYLTRERRRMDMQACPPGSCFRVNKRGARWLLVAFIPFAASVLLLVHRFVPYVTDSFYTPLLAANYLDARSQNAQATRLFTGFNNGAYMEFRGYDVYFDARPELFSDKISGGTDILREYLALSTDPDFDYDRFIEGYGFTHLCIEKDTLFYAYMRGKGAAPVVDAADYALFETELCER